MRSLLILLVWFSGNVQQGIRVNRDYPVESLVRDVFLKSGCGNVSNIKSVGDQRGIGYFENAKDIIGLDRGIILATGPVENALGPNLLPDTRGDFNDKTGDVDLEKLSKTIVYDPVGLEFEFVPVDQYVTFRYVFASEEYCEFVGSEFNDVFGFFIQGPGLNGEFSNNGINIAFIPNTNEYVAINSVNHLRNKDFYISNHLAGDDSRCDLLFSPKPLRDFIEYDGFTKVFATTIRVVPCKTYKIRLVIADVGDHFFDSAVFLEAKSFNLGGDIELTTQTPEGSGILSEGCQEGYFVFKRSDPTKLGLPVSVPIKITDQSTAIPGVDYVPFPEFITIPAGDSLFRLPVTTLDNQISQEDRSLSLELNFECECIEVSARIIIKDPAPLLVFPYDTVVCPLIPLWINPNVEGGVPPYVYALEDSLFTRELYFTPERDTVLNFQIKDTCGQKAETFIRIQVYDQPQSSIMGNANTCLADSAIFDITLDGVSPFSFGVFRNGILLETFNQILDQSLEWVSKEAGIYTLGNFFDKNCPGLTFDSAVHKNEIIQTDISWTEPNCENSGEGEITIRASGGLPPYQYQWNTGNGKNLIAGTYSVTITDQMNCAVSRVIELPRKECLDRYLFIPTAFSPNGDGINEVFNLYYVGFEPIQIEKIEIYDRWGGLVFFRENVSPGDAAGGWDGGDYPSGLYVYSIVFRNTEGPVEEKKGWVNLIR